MKKLLPVLFVTSIFIGCNSQNNDSGNSGNNTKESNSANASESTSERKVVNIYDESACFNYLKGKNFYCSNGRLEFTYDGNVALFNRYTNEMVFTGNLEVAGMANEGLRTIKIHSSAGGNDALQMTLGDDGKLMDATDFTIYKPR